MSISSISFENYKGYPSGNLNISPITILLGANSAGKSSIIQLVLMFAQTFKHTTGNKQLILNGKYIELGESINLMRNKSTDEMLSFSLHLEDIYPIENITTEYIDYMQRSLSLILRSYNEILYELSLYHESESAGNLRISKLINSNNQFLRIHRLKAYREGIGIDEIIKNAIKLINRVKAFLKKDELINSSISEEDALYTTVVQYNKLSKIKISEYNRAIEVTKSLHEYSITHIKYDFLYLNKSLKINNMVFMDNEKEFIKISFFNSKTNRKKFSVSSDYMDKPIIKILERDLGNSLDVKRLLPVLDEHKSTFRNSSNFIKLIQKSPIAILVYAIMGESATSVSGIFRRNKIHHVRPIRAYPKRYHIITEETDNLINSSTNNTEGLIAVLENRPDVKDQVNIWLKKKFNIEISVKNEKDLIYSIFVQRDGLSLNLSDVGFGISQVLPILMQIFLAENGSVVIIEQPEIHIHPKAQADLADLCIEVSKNKHLKLIIETHSEAFLKRLRRRISEYNYYKDMPYENPEIMDNPEILTTLISSNDVSIHNIERHSEDDNFYSTITEVDVSDSGEFKWPKEFLDFSFDDNINFIKNQQISDS